MKKPAARAAKQRASVPASSEGRIGRPVPRGVHSFTRTYPYVVQVLDTLTHYALPAQLNNLPNYTEFTTLFDDYRINLVEYMFVFDENSASVASANTPSQQSNFIPNLLTVHDYDDAALLTAVTDYCQYETFQCARLDKAIHRYVRPKSAQAVYGAGALTQYAQTDSNPWIDAGYPGAEFYGLKFAVVGNMEGGAGTRQLGMLTIYIRYHIECRDTR
jgi:hypothetical protein